jgi:16S rRNA (uracil1498-N3)-methyltransferase
LQPNKIHRIYVEKKISVNERIDLNDCLLKRIKNVLRIKNLENIFIFNGDGKEYLSEVNYKNKSYLKIIKQNRKEKLSNHTIVLAQCIPSYKYMDFAIQKSTELGINEIIPIISSRSHPGKHENKYEHWRKIIIHAVEQSNGLYLPKLHNATTLEGFLNDVVYNSYYKICFHLKGRKLLDNDKKFNKHAILIGPEGGFSNDDILLIKKYNWNIISLGDRILRTETAAIVAQNLLRY